MPLRNACFISYRHGQYDLMKEFTTGFYAALRAELEPMFGGNAVYLDQDRVCAGQFYSDALAANLYESATMVMVYTPTYFTAEQTYCAREYKAMEALERARLAALGAAVDKSHGLIIPVVLRGAKYLPQEIQQRRQFYNFEGFQLGGPRLSRHPRFSSAIRDIAAYICDRFQELSTLPDNLFEGPERFRLPEDDEIRGFLDLVSGFRMAFPRSGVHLAPEAAAWAR